MSKELRAGAEFLSVELLKMSSFNFVKTGKRINILIGEEGMILASFLLIHFEV